LKKKDLLGLAPTGSGKTAAYILPILDTLQLREEAKDRNIPVLILVPTRELAVQVEEVLNLFGALLPRNIKSLAIFGGVSINPQMKHLYGTEILIATPGRLLDLISKNALQLSKVETLVLDEADKILNLGFKDEVDKILSLLPEKRQNILFSATMEEAVETWLARIASSPVKVQVDQDTITPESIVQSAYLVSPEKKGPLLIHLIKRGGRKQVLVFTSSIRAADNLAVKLNKNGIQALSFHGDKSQG